MRVAFVLSGGASLGAPQAGMLQALHEHGIRPRLEEDIPRYAGSVDLTVIPAPRIDRVMPIDFGHADELILAGLRSAHGILGQTRHVVPLRDAA